MAEVILFNVAANIIIKLGSSAVREIGLVWGVDDEIEKLKNTVSAIQAVLLDAEEQQSQSHAIKDWISKLKDAFYDIDDLMDDFSYEASRRQILTRGRRKSKQVCFFFSKSIQIVFRLKIAHKIKEIRERLKAINDDKNQFSFSSQPVMIDTRQKHDDWLRRIRDTGSYIPQEEVIGRNDDKNAVIDLLLNTNTTEDITIISIVGMGGLGKTALAQSIYNHKRVTSNQFELKLWVCVSEEFDLNIIIRKIIESATGNILDSSLQMDTLEKELRSQIGGKKYLLIMDDVWNETREDWLHLKRLLKGGAKGSRILITTRSERVAKTFDATFLHYLQTLNKWNSWLLFQRMTGLEEVDNQEEVENSNLIQIGKEILLRLKGVPLVIRSIGSILKDNKSERFWLSFKDKELYQVLKEGQNDVKQMRLILNLSYKYLPANLKQCFLYCALFPKDYEIKKHDLILLWRAQGFIQTNANEKVIDVGDDYFMELLARSFFQEVTKDKRGDIKACKMHDMMHDLACSIMNNECVHGLNGTVIDKRTHHFSSKGGYDCGKELLVLSKATNLRTFCMLHGARGSLSDFEKIFDNHLRLRTLHFNLWNVHPNAKFWALICKLKHLTYLSIMGLDIKNLPNSIMKLYNLETFIFQDSSDLETLPTDIRNFINLRHLDISNNRDLKFLPDSITELCKLEALILRNCTELQELPENVGNWINLKQLDLSGNNYIKFLPNSITQLNNLETLNLHGCYNLKELPKDTKRLINLKHLDLYGCLALTHMPEGLGELINLETMDRFVLGENKGCELNELDGLTKLKGTLSIINLEFCTSVDRQTKGKFLKLKSDLQELELNWSISCIELAPHHYHSVGQDRHYRYNYRKPTTWDLDDDVINKSILDCLQPHSNLQKISITKYEGVKLCNWVSSNSLGCLVTLRLEGCERLQHLPRLDQFPYLKRIWLIDLPSIEYIIIVNNDDDIVSSSTFFSSLEELHIVHMPKLVRWCKGTTSTKSPITFFPSLKELIIVGMPKLKRWWNGTTSTESPIRFPCLYQLQIDGCPLHILKSCHAPNLNSLRICGSKDGLDVVPWKNFENLSSLTLWYMIKLEYLPDCLQDMTSLRYFSLFSCGNLKNLPEWICNLTSLRSLHISSCEKLTSLPEGIQHMNDLERISFNGCETWTEKGERQRPRLSVR